MKKFHFLTFSLAVALAGCANILGGDNDAVERVSLEDLQGCRYFEYRSSSSYDCTEICISDSIYHAHYRYYVHPHDAISVDNASWSLYSESTDSAIVQVLAPEKDGKFENNVQLIYTYRSGYSGTYTYYNNYVPYSDTNKITADKLSSNYHQGSEGWTLCNE